MFEHLKNFLSDRISKFLDVDLEKHPQEPFYEFFERKMNKIIYFSGSFMRLAPEHILWTVTYNFFVAAVPVVVYILTAITLVKQNLELPALILLGHYVCIELITSLGHLHISYHRVEGITYGLILMQWEKLERPIDLEVNAMESVRKFFTRYWAFMIYGMWSVYMIGMPSYDYFILSISYSLPFPLWFPFDTNRPIGFLAGYIFEILSVNCICLQIITGIPCYVYACYVLIFEYDYLIKSLRTLHEDALSNMQTMHESTPKPPGYQLYADPHFLFCLRKRLKEIVEHHQTVISLIESLKKMTDLTLTMLLGMGSIIIACATFFLVSDIGDLSLKMTFAGLLVINLFIIGIMCYLGEQIHSQGEKFREALYFTNWYDWPDDMKRTLRIMLARTLNPPTLSGAYVTVNPNYEAFATVLNSAYSLINLLIALKN